MLTENAPFVLLRKVRKGYSSFAPLISASIFHSNQEGSCGKQVVIRDTPIGPLTVAARSGRICAVHFGEKLPFQAGESPDLESEPVLGKAVLVLEAYFSGDLREFTVPVALDGPPFHVRVWEAPHPNTLPGKLRPTARWRRSSGVPGEQGDRKRVCRQPGPVIVPCHRVLASAGLGGYGGGLPAKSGCCVTRYSRLRGSSLRIPCRSLRG